MFVKQKLLRSLQGENSGPHCENELLREKKGKWSLCRKQEGTQM